jgi:hypothetical protein
MQVNISRNKIWIPWTRHDLIHITGRFFIEGPFGFTDLLGSIRDVESVTGESPV